MEDPAERFAQALLAVEGELDWRVLAGVYCQDEGRGFFAPEQVEAIRETGLLLADDLAARLAVLPSQAPPASLYVGAGVAELVPMLCETVVLGRQVSLVGLPGPELEALDSAFDTVGRRFGWALPQVTDRPLAEVPIRPVSHGWLVSVLTDPERFPALHDALYQRTGREAVGGGDRELELVAARRLVAALLGHLEPPAVLTTTDEEAGLVQSVCQEQGLLLEIASGARLSGVVGDPVRVCRLLRRPPGP